MSAKIQPRIDLEKRTKLEEVIPLRTPFVLHVEPTNLCNLGCRFCPVGDHELIKQSGIHQGMLSLELFKKAIDDLSDFEDKVKAIHMYGNGEPLLNKHFHEMVRYARESGRVEFIDTTTNGLLFTPEKIDLIIAAGLDKINISVNGLSTEQYFKFTQTKVDFNKFLKHLQYLFDHRGECKIYIKSISELYDEEDKKRFFEMFSPVADYIFLENLTDPWPHHHVKESIGLDSKRSAFTDKITDKYVCSVMFYTLILNFDGTCSLCCVDWKNELIVGDANRSSLKEIWQSEALFRHQMQHLNGERFNNPICRDCNQIMQCVYDDIDPFRLELAVKLQNSRSARINNCALGEK